MMSKNLKWANIELLFTQSDTLFICIDLTN